MFYYLLIILCLFLQAFFNTSEISFLSADRLQVELDKNKGNATSKAQEFIYSRTGRFITTVLVGNNITNVIYGLLIAKVLEGYLFEVIGNDFVVVLLQTIISTTLVIIFAEYIPKSIAQARPNQQLRLVAIPLYLFYWLLYPITIFATWISSLIFKAIGVKNEEGSMVPLGKVDLDYYIENKSGNSEDEHHLSEARILQNALEFSDIKVRDCLVPRNEIAAVDLEASMEELLEKFEKSGHSKILIYRNTIDDIIGYVHSIEMFECNENNSPWQTHIKQTEYVPESLAGEKVLRSMLHKKRNIAIVVDELGGTAGIVTLEDLVEEIFGEIEDEHDTKRVVMHQAGPNEYVISGRAEIDLLNETFGLEIPENDEYKTIAGFILYYYQGFPSRDEELMLPPNFQVKIIRATDNKITLVRLRKVTI